MADDSSMDAKIAALMQKVEKESRFTRSLVVVCTAAILGVSLVPVKIMLADLPNLLISEFMTKLEVMHTHWKILDRVHVNAAGEDEGSSAPEPAPAEAK